MDFTSYLAHLQHDPEYRGQLVHVEEISPRPSAYSSTIEPLNPELEHSLRRMGINRLYIHQASAVDHARAGHNIVVVTATASGKTLCYNLPVLEAVLADRNARALYLYPTKALAQDQLGKLGDFDLFPRVRYATYDGDTEKEERRYIRKGAQIVLTNPDMLHMSMMPNHAAWAAFYAHLKYVVIDEIHTYRGVFGAHVAQIMRRLRRVCSHYGSSPLFIATSATVANPADLMRKITGANATVIDEDGAPTGKRLFAFWNPPMIEDEDKRSSANVEAMRLFTDLVENNVKTVAFTKARKLTELILRYARDVFRKRESPLVDRITSYRAGYTPKQRREIEEGLFSGELLGVTSTSALELGVDIGGLDASIMVGYPGTIASAWQQAGRAGRGRDDSLAVMIAYDNPLDQYLMRHPDYFFGRPHEQAVVDPDNRRILAAHLVCAAFEKALNEDDLPAFGKNAAEVVAQLEEEGALQRRNGRWCYRGDGYPPGEVNIRSASGDIFEICDETKGAEVIGTIERVWVYLTTYPGAIYLHQGENYLVKKLDEENKVISVTPVEVNYYTQPREMVFITVLSEMDSRPLGCTQAYFGEVVVTTQVLGYRKKRQVTDEVLEIVDLELPEQAFETEAFWFTVPTDLAVEICREHELPGSIHAIEHAAIGMMPLLSMCDRWDIGGVSSPNHPDTGLATIFIYDGYPGGVGIVEATYDRLKELLTETATMITECECRDGCPSCVQSPKCGNNNEPLDKLGAVWLLKQLLC